MRLHDSIDYVEIGHFKVSSSVTFYSTYSGIGQLRLFPVVGYSVIISLVWILGVCFLWVHLDLFLFWVSSLLRSWTPQILKITCILKILALICETLLVNSSDNLYFMTIDFECIIQNFCDIICQWKLTNSLSAIWA